MPDGDELPKGLDRTFSDTYKQLIEGKFSPEKIAHTALTNVDNKLKRYQKDLSRPLFDLVDMLEQHQLNDPIFRQMADWKTINEKAEMILRSVPRKIKNILTNTISSTISELQHNFTDSSNTSEKLAHNCLKSIFDNALDDCIPFMDPRYPYFYNNTNLLELTSLINDVRHCFSNISKDHADKIIRNQDTTKASTPKRKINRNYNDLDLDINMVGN